MAGVTATVLDAFDAYLDDVVERAPDDPNRALIRRHFGVDDPSAKRGKRMRPRILLTVAEAEGSDPHLAFGAAAAIELLHNFSLIHDDMEDGDEVRHGRPTLWSEYGNRSALIAGNAMSSLAYLTLIAGSTALAPECVAAMLACLQEAHYRMCEGQAFDIGFETSSTVTFDEYVRMIGGKTAALLGASCELGALAAGCDATRAGAYGQVGRVYGLAFQVRDDALGAWGLPDQTGKPSGADIRRRKWSFPVAWAISGPPSAERGVIARAYAKIGVLDDAVADAVLVALERLGAREAADRTCADYIEQAKALAATHDLDREGRLADFLASTAQRTV